MKTNLKILSMIFALFSLCFSTSSVEASVFDDMKVLFKERSEIKEHTKIMTKEIKVLYGERNSIQRFTSSAAILADAYKGIKDKNSKASIPQLLEIVSSIGTLMNEFSNLAPKAESMYQNVKPSMQYFSELANETNTINTSTKKVLLRSISNERIDKLSVSGGWGRVWDSVKENPLDVFRWGKLKDEYDMGKAETKYPLKCAQMVFEVSGYYVAAKEVMNELSVIKNEIEKILKGNLGSILNIANILDNISDAGETAIEFGELVKEGPELLDKRLKEFVVMHNDFIAKNKAYNTKYNEFGYEAVDSDRQNTNSNNNAQQGVHINSGSSGSPFAEPKSASNSLQKATANYEKAYKKYSKLTQEGKFTSNELTKAINDLTKAKRDLQNAKKNSGQ